MEATAELLIGHLALLVSNQVVLAGKLDTKQTVLEIINIVIDHSRHAPLLLFVIRVVGGWLGALIC